MLLANSADSQQSIFAAVLAGLERIGYTRELLCRDYAVRDWFSPGGPPIKVDAAAFGRTPVSYDNACFAVVKANGGCGPELIAQYRALGAPRALEVRADRVIHWKVTASPSESDLWEIYQPSEIENAFQAHKQDWNPDGVLRARNVAGPGPRQLDFVDLGLIPALEHEIREKLHPLLSGIIDSARNAYRERRQREPDWGDLCRLLFRSLAGKIMHDRRHYGFRSICGVPDADALLAKVQRHYRDHRPVTDDRDVRQLVVRQMWGSVGFENLSVEILAYIWENTLVSDDLRRKLSIHATPSSVARYVVHRLPIESIPEADRRVVEPCCGSGTFLVAALQRLRQLLPAAVNARQRHNYFAQRLAGFDVEPFGLEVARNSLMLTDYPNPNGWTLEQEDVFATPDKATRYRDAVAKARIILCNPPFSDFDEEERRRYRPRSVHKPAELLLRLSQALPAQALVGFVLPRIFLDGRGYREARRAVAQRFEEVELVSLPEKVFGHAQHETALLIARAPRRDSRSVSLVHRKVSDAGAPAFLSRYQATREDRAQRPQERVAEVIGVPDLQEIWERLEKHPTLGDVTEEIHRGIEWNIPLTRKNPRTGKRERIAENVRQLISATPRKGFVKGVKDVPRELFCFQIPATTHLNLSPECQRRNAYALPWNEGKVVLNAARRSRGPWRIVSFADLAGLVFYQTFTCVWPAKAWHPGAVAAILNAPLANAYIDAHEHGGKHITKEVLARVPVPELGSLDQARLTVLVEQYLSAMKQPGILGSFWDSPREALRQIDALVLKAYGLPPRLERQLLDHFRGHERPVPFVFGDYYPEDFTAYIPLWMFESGEFRKSTARRFLAEFPEIDNPDVLGILADL